MKGCLSRGLIARPGRALDESQILQQFYLRTLRETLDSVVTPAVRDGLLERALSLAGLDQTPANPPEFAHFLAAPLRLAMSEALGPELSDTLIAELEHLVRPSFRPGQSAPKPPERTGSKPIGAVTLKKSRVNEVDPPSQPRHAEQPGLPPMRAPTPLPRTEPTKAASSAPASSPVSHSYPNGIAETLGLEGSGAPSSAGRTRIFLATRRDEFQRRFESFLSETTRVSRVDDVLDLVRRLEGNTERSLLVVDCKQSSLRPIALAALADDMPTNVRVILWGASRSLRTQIAQLAPDAEGWLIVDGEDTDLHLLAKRCEQAG